MFWLILSIRPSRLSRPRQGRLSLSCCGRTARITTAERSSTHSREAHKLSNSHLVFVVNSERIPPPGMRVVVILEPVLEAIRQELRPFAIEPNKPRAQEQKKEHSGLLLERLSGCCSGSGSARRTYR